MKWQGCGIQGHGIRNLRRLLLPSMQTYYNYLRPHQGIGGMVPAQMASIPINLIGNRWETMIGLAATK